ncbi:MAG: hypothetical protein ACK58L_15160 [Planctomycetota bacterium]
MLFSRLTVNSSLSPGECAELLTSLLRLPSSGSWPRHQQRINDVRPTGFTLLLADNLLYPVVVEGSVESDSDLCRLEMHPFAPTLSAFFVVGVALPLCLSALHWMTISPADGEDFKLRTLVILLLCFGLTDAYLAVQYWRNSRQLAARIGRLISQATIPDS